MGIPSSGEAGLPPLAETVVIPSRADASRQQILNVAAGFLRNRGYAETSLRDIAAAVGMKAGSLYYHFESKDLLVIEILHIGVERVHSAVLARLQALPLERHRERIGAAILAHLEVLLAEGDFAPAYIRCFPYVPDQVKEKMRGARKGYQQVWSDLFEAAAGDGALRDGVEPRAARLAILGALNASLEWFNPLRDQPQKFAEMLSLCFCR